MKKHKYTKEDCDYIIKNLHITQSPHEVAEGLGVTLKSITTKASQMRKDGFNVSLPKPKYLVGEQSTTKNNGSTMTREKQEDGSWKYVCQNTPPAASNIIRPKRKRVKPDARFNGAGIITKHNPEGQKLVIIDHRTSVYGLISDSDETIRERYYSKFKK